MSDPRELVEEYYRAWNDRDWSSYEQLFNAEAETLELQSQLGLQ